MICIDCKKDVTIDTCYYHCFFCGDTVCEKCLNLDNDDNAYYQDIHCCKACIPYIPIFRSAENDLIQAQHESMEALLIFAQRMVMDGRPDKST